jgi:hypothetical protein
MAKRLFYAAHNFTNTASAPTVITSNNHMTLLGASATQMTDVLEVLISGQNTSSNIGAFTLIRSSGTVAATPAAFVNPDSDGPMVPATAALAAPVVTAVGFTTNPQASATTTDGRLNFGLNTFGGILRWNAAPTQQWQLLGSATGFGCSVFFNSTAAGATSAALATTHIIYETY